VHKGKAHKIYHQDIPGWRYGSRLYVCNFHDAFRKGIDVFNLVNAALQEATSEPQPNVNADSMPCLQPYSNTNCQIYTPYYRKYSNESHELSPISDAFPRLECLESLALTLRLDRIMNSTTLNPIRSTFLHPNRRPDHRYHAAEFAGSFLLRFGIKLDACGLQQFEICLVTVRRQKLVAEK
jgi:hypothetical protein